VAVGAPSAACAWRATASEQWIAVSGDGRTGSGQLTFTAAANPSRDERTGTLSVAGQVVTITQAGSRRGDEETTVNGKISGLSGSCPNLSFTISGTVVVVNGATEYRGKESCQNLQNGRNARVRGRVQANGTLLADRVDNISGGGG
jgi:hypothetical protein